MKTCECGCGRPVERPYGKLAEPCRIERLKHGGKSAAAKLNYAKREKQKRDERRSLLTAVPVTAKCPTCLRRHTIDLPPALVEKNKMPRIYCPVHEGNRSRSEDTYAFGSLPT